MHKFTLHLCSFHYLMSPFVDFKRDEKKKSLHLGRANSQKSMFQAFLDSQTFKRRKMKNSIPFLWTLVFWQFPWKGCVSLSQHAILHDSYSQNQIKARNGLWEIDEDSPSLAVLTPCPLHATLFLTMHTHSLALALATLRNAILKPSWDSSLPRVGSRYMLIYSYPAGTGICPVLTQH